MDGSTLPHHQKSQLFKMRNFDLLTWQERILQLLPRTSWRRLGPASQRIQSRVPGAFPKRSMFFFCTILTSVLFYSWGLERKWTKRCLNGKIEIEKKAATRTKNLSWSTMVHSWLLTKMLITVLISCPSSITHFVPPPPKHFQGVCRLNQSSFSSLPQTSFEFLENHFYGKGSH